MNLHYQLLKGKCKYNNRIHKGSQGWATVAQTRLAVKVNLQMAYSLLTCDGESCVSNNCKK